jgi:hypothetical protein
MSTKFVDRFNIFYRLAGGNHVHEAAIAHAHAISGVQPFQKGGSAAYSAHSRRGGQNKSNVAHYM